MTTPPPQPHVQKIEKELHHQGTSTPSSFNPYSGGKPCGGGNKEEGVEPARPKGGEVCEGWEGRWAGKEAGTESPTLPPPSSTPYPLPLTPPLWSGGFAGWQPHGSGLTFPAHT